jgi:hypothetical protein
MNQTSRSVVILCASAAAVSLIAFAASVAADSAPSAAQARVRDLLRHVVQLPPSDVALIEGALPGTFFIEVRMPGLGSRNTCYLWIHERQLEALATVGDESVGAVGAMSCVAGSD